MLQLGITVCILVGGVGAPSRADPAPAIAAAPGPGAGPSGAAPASPVPLGYRIVKAPTLVYAAPTRRAERRGRVTTRQPFAIHSVQPGADCPGEGWAAVDQGGFVCLEYAVPSEGPARVQPELPAARLLPFIYARPRIVDRRSRAIATVPRYRDLAAYRRGDEPTSVLEPDRHYTFVKTKRHRRQELLIDAENRVVARRGMNVAAESTFSGRDLAREPIPVNVSAAWSVGRPAALRRQPAASAAALRQVAYHATMHVDPRPIAAGEELWYAVPDGGGPGVTAYVAARDMNHWIPGPELAEVGPDELWIDVELGQQTLAVMRGQSAVFITLISSGAAGSTTPQGLFRVYEKLAVWTMRSGPNAADPYFVEGVPWIQYFHQRFALHASYWHDDFGKRRSHGCINLSPRDAAHVFSLTSPRVPSGWNALVEHPGAAGTLVRVRRGVDPVPDRRLPLGTIDAGVEDPLAPEIPEPERTVPSR